MLIIEHKVSRKNIGKFILVKNDGSEFIAKITGLALTGGYRLQVIEASGAFTKYFIERSNKTVTIDSDDITFLESEEDLNRIMVALL